MISSTGSFYRACSSSNLVFSFTVIGSQRGHENPAMLSLSIMWMRYHNAIAKEIVNQYPNITDQDAFTLTRNKVIAVLQVMTPPHISQ